MTDANVIIVGGGPVGLGLAVELGQAGVPTLLFEPNVVPSPIPKGQNLTQRTLEHFHFWGAEEALRHAQTIPPSYGVGGLTAYGSLLGGIHYDWLQRDLVGEYYYTRNGRLPQYETERVLRERVTELPHVRMMVGWRVLSVEQDDDGVDVIAEEAGGDVRQNFRAAFAVGCDGSHSLVRESAGISQTLDDRNRLMALLLFRSEGLNVLLERFPGKSYYNVLNPELEGYWQFFGRVDLDGRFFFHAPVPPEARSEDFDFVGMLRRAIGAECDIAIEHRGFWDLRFAIADRYRNGRIFIAGDAAHSHPPYGGYGINSGLEDARNLGWKLAAHHGGWAGPGLLDSYDAERRPVFASTARDFIAASIHRDRDFLTAFAPDRDAAAFAREWAARATGAKEEVGRFAPQYAGSPIIGSGGTSSAVGDHRHRARAGHHLSPGLLPSGRNSYALLGRGFTLFTTDPSSAGPWQVAANALSIPLRLVIGSVPAYEAAHVLVRPDQFVAWSGDDGMEPGAVLSRACGYST